jgi:hypothetical protein
MSLCDGWIAPPHRRRQEPMTLAPPLLWRQKLNGCSITGVQRVFFTTDRNDWLDA